MIERTKLADEIIGWFFEHYNSWIYIHIKNQFMSMTFYFNIEDIIIDSDEILIYYDDNFIRLFITDFKSISEDELSFKSPESEITFNAKHGI